MPVVRGRECRAQQPGKPKPPGNPRQLPDRDRPPPIEDPPEPIPMPPDEQEEPPPMEAGARTLD